MLGTLFQGQDARPFNIIILEVLVHVEPVSRVNAAVIEPNVTISLQAGIAS